MDTLESFNDVTVGAELFNVLRLGPEDFKFPANEAKLRDIAGFLNEHPDPLWLIQHLGRKHTTSLPPLDHFYSYVQLSKEKAAYESKLEKLNKDLKFYD